jgi:hypothetical protein
MVRAHGIQLPKSPTDFNTQLGGCWPTLISPRYFGVFVIDRTGYLPCEQEVNTICQASGGVIQILSGPVRLRLILDISVSPDP